MIPTKSCRTPSNISSAWKRILGCPIERTTKHTGFDKMLRVYGGMLPQIIDAGVPECLKLKPFETYVGDDPVINYVGLRADENRTGYISHKPNIKVVYPFQRGWHCLRGLVRILEESGLGCRPTRIGDGPTQDAFSASINKN